MNAPPDSPATPRVLLAAAIAALAACAPFTRWVAWLGDEGVLLEAAARMAEGQAPYRDFFALLPPLPYALTAAWTSTFGGTLLSVRVLAIGGIVLLAMLTVATARRAAGSARAALGLVVLWLLGSQGVWTVLNHRWLSMLAATAAMALLLRAVGAARAPGRTFGAGLMVGLAAAVTPPVGVAVGLACGAALLLARRPPRAHAALAVGALLPLALSAAILEARGLGGPARAAFLFMTRGYSSIQPVPFAAGTNVQNFAIAGFFPVVLAGGAVLALRAPSGEARRQVLILGAFALAGFALSWPRPDVVHIAFGVPLGAPLGAVVAVALVGAARASAHRLALLGVGALVYALTAVGWAQVVGDASRATPVETARGAARLAEGTQPAELDALFRALERAPELRIFVYPYDAMLTYLTGRTSVGPYEDFTPGYARPEHYRGACEAVLAGADLVVLDREQLDPATLRRMWPAIADVRPPERVAFERVLEDAFELLRPAAPRFELRRRRPSADPSTCAALGVLTPAAARAPAR